MRNANSIISMQYDRAVDALAVTFRAVRSARTVRVSDTILIDVDVRGRLVALELLDASWHLPKEALDAMPTAAQEYTLAEAERASGLRASTLRVLLNRGRLAGRKRGRDWYVDATALENYLESREARGRPADNAHARRRAV